MALLYAYICANIIFTNQGVTPNLLSMEWDTAAGQAIVEQRDGVGVQNLGEHSRFLQRIILE